jgi:hypothetical protein
MANCIKTDMIVNVLLLLLPYSSMTHSRRPAYRRTARASARPASRLALLHAGISLEGALYWQVQIDRWERLAVAVDLSSILGRGFLLGVNRLELSLCRMALRTSIELASSEPWTTLGSLLKHEPLFRGEFLTHGVKGFQCCQALLWGRGALRHVNLYGLSFR